jgi:hypothetical protein
METVYKFSKIMAIPTLFCGYECWILREGQKAGWELRQDTERSITDAVKVQGVLGRTNRLLSFDTLRIALKTTLPTFLLLLHVYSLRR